MKAASIYARLGWSVVPLHDVASGACSCGKQPCPSAGKHPRLRDWTTQASSDPTTIAEWARSWPSANIGAVTGDQFFVLDVDPDNGGPASLAELTEVHGDLPETPTQRTGSGGTHYLFQPVAGISNSAGKLGAGLDVRGSGGQIVVAPSVSLKGSYSWVAGREPWNIPLAPAPAWLLELLRRPAPTSARPGASTEDRGYFPAASPELLDQAELALEAHGPAVEGAGGDAHTFRAAALLTHDFALTEEEAWPLLWAWNLSCDPQWTPEDLIVKLRNGAEYGQGEYGRARALDAVETAKKLIADWSAGQRDDASQWVLIERCRKLAQLSGDPTKHASITRDLQAATGFNRRDLAIPPAKVPSTRRTDGKEIHVGPQLAEVADEALTAIAPQVFARSGVLCEVIPGDRAGGTWIHDLETTRIQDLMSRAATWVRDDDKGQAETAAPLPVAAILAARRMHEGVRVLEAVTTAPVFLADGSILQERGYSAAARLWLEPSIVVDVPDEPTLAQAHHAVTVLRDLVCDYHFASEADFAAWLAGVISPLVKSATDNAPAPLFLVTASSRAAGKTMLAQLASLIVTGAEVGVSTYSPKDPAEWEKKLTAFVREASPVVVFDNIALGVELGDDGLDRLLTSSTWKGRILGVSEAPPLPVVGCWWATGNNTEARNDTVRRVLPVRIEVDEERPQERDDFKRAQLKLFALEYRATYLSAALTILRAWHCAGRPAQGLPTWGSFEVWSDLVRSALVWAGCADPFETQRRASAVLNEPENTAHDFWLKVVGSCDGTPASLCAKANESSAQEVLGMRELLTPRLLGKFIGPYVDKPRLRRRIRRHVDPARFVIEAIHG